uniref:YkvI family membrane protein n=1 Tax=uncultured Sphingomonas sp. TaxID=158754 RepID=UPI0035C943C9
MTALAADSRTSSSLFKRLILPGLAFKAVVIGGGYATGREIAEFFLPAGPWGGLAAMALAMLVWSIVCIATFLFARATGAQEYRAFFTALLGRGWIVFEIAYALFVVLILAVFGAAAGAIGAATLGTPPILGTLALMAAIAGFAAFGNAAVERLFAYVSILLYGVYALFLILALTRFGDRIAAAFAAAPAPAGSWALGGITYAGYNIVGAVIILPVTRHLTSNRDAIVAGAIAGPLAMLPAVLFFTCMTAFVPAIAGAVLPSDYMLVRLDQPAFHLLFQGMIFAALLESGTGAVHAINQRIASVWERRHGLAPGRLARGATALALLLVCMLLAERIGLVALIAGGYRLLAYVLIAIYVLPLLTIGLWRLKRPAFAQGDPA